MTVPIFQSVNGWSTRIVPFVLSAAVLGVLLPLSDWRAETATRLSQVRAELEHLNKSIAELQAEMTRLSAGIAESYRWSAPQLGEASAMVQSRISDVARQVGVSLRQISPLPDRDIGSSGLLGFRIELEATVDNFVKFLIQVEQNSPALTVRRATVRRLTRAEVVSSQPFLFVQIDLLAPVALENTK
ncbi:type II secretion system protein GspM [Frigidibacter sp. SD6-1]|uniref:type II secretion system protein GspM n=1 Tax=Frigidibacter sp. SD6-1 TaxID=3032581 RepID=UPI0024DF9072|nr:type II secretion system protein GspM [Frigidibacter sp. SD6-1]